MLDCFWVQKDFSLVLSRCLTCIVLCFAMSISRCTTANIQHRSQSVVQKQVTRADAIPVTLTLPDNHSLTIRDHAYPLDDLYCFVNGWYSMPGDRHALMNFSYLEEVSDKFCDQLEKTMPEYHKLSASSFFAESEGDEHMLEVAVNSSGRWHVPETVVHGMQVHAAVKCVMRGGGWHLLTDHGITVCMESSRSNRINLLL